MSLNRTIVVLKALTDKGGGERFVGLNRTLVVLKEGRGCIPPNSRGAFNRTVVVLKVLGAKAHAPSLAVSIVPLWC